MSLSFILITERIFITYRYYFYMLFVLRHDCHHFILRRQTIGGIRHNQYTVGKFLKQLVKRICSTIASREWCGIRFELLCLRMLLNLYAFPITGQALYKMVSAHIFII